MDTGTSNGELPGWRGEEGQKHREEDEKRREKSVGWGRSGKARKGGEEGEEMTRADKAFASTFLHQ